MSRSRAIAPSEAPGLAARRVAAEVVEGVLRRGRPIDELLDPKQALTGFGTLAERDRALARNLAGTVLRRAGTLRHVCATYLDRGFPADAPRVESALLVGATQLLWFDVPDHAAVDLAVRTVQADRRAGRYAGLVNAVLRRIAQERSSESRDGDAGRDTPDWLAQRWRRTYGEPVAVAIMAANRNEPALDLTVKSDPATWAARLRGRVLPTGSVRMVPHGPIPLLPGYDEGAWWVQDAAATLPVRLLGEMGGIAVLDMCAAPGGKTAQLAFAGARVTAIDRSSTRVQRLKDNLARLKLSADVIVADATEWEGGPFDAILVDAPCLSTGTIRRHPDIAWLKRGTDLPGLVALQNRLLDRAAALVKPGGTVIYSTCSLEPEEGEGMIAGFLAREPRLRRRPVRPADVGGLEELVTIDGDLRTLPSHLPDDDPQMAGLDGFYAARLVRTG